MKDAIWVLIELSYWNLRAPLQIPPPKAFIGGLLTTDDSHEIMAPHPVFALKKFADSQSLVFGTRDSQPVFHQTQAQGKAALLQLPGWNLENLEVRQTAQAESKMKSPN